jgi:hypothetical protein
VPHCSVSVSRAMISSLENLLAYFSSILIRTPAVIMGNR